ncbi:hypothetical protein ACFRI7_31750 [Streptomyces sp. NPDC056716]|uniref:hypothetical protein n=1 Tax=unclassified Streptomyces TaxID=2593676 RepID=UPI0036CCB3E3
MAQRLPNVRLRDAIAESRWTYAALAHAVRQVAAENGEALRTNKSTVDHWIAGAVPSGQTGRYLTIALSRRLGRPLAPQDLGLPAPDGWENDSIGLSLADDPLEALMPIWRGDLDRRRFLSGAAYSVAAAVLPLEHVTDIASRAAKARTGARVGHADVAAVRDMITMFAVMDERHGGQHGRSALVQYLMTDVAALCRGRFGSEDDHRHMLSAAAVGVHQAGWRAYDGGEQGLAQRYYLQSYALAHESAITGHDAFVMRTMSQQGMKLHRPEHCLALAETAVGRVHGRVDTQTEALFAITHAHALAKAGQRREAVREVERARTALGSAKGDDVPFWALSWGPPDATVRSRTAKVFETLGDRRRAAAMYGAAASSRPPGYERIIALDLVAQAEMQAAEGNIEQACTTWGRAIDHMDGVQSSRTRKAVSNIRRDLSRFRTRGLRCATELDERARGLLSDSH